MPKKYWFLFIHIAPSIEPKTPFKNSPHANPHDIANDSSIFKSDVLKWVNSNFTTSKEEYDAKDKKLRQFLNQLCKRFIIKGGVQGGMPNFYQSAGWALGAEPEAQSKGTTSCGTEDVKKTKNIEFQNE